MPDTLPTIPWRVVAGLLDDDAEGNARFIIRPVVSRGWQIAQTVGPHGKEHADLIVRAVNSHDALVKALKDVRAFLKAIDPYGGSGRFIKEVDAALARAKAQGGV